MNTRARLSFMLPVLLMLSLGMALPVTADQRFMDKEDHPALKRIIGMDYERQKQVFERIGIPVSDDFYHCLCSRARYGSSTTSTSYHPAALPGWDDMYICGRPGGPCMTRGFGCWRNPLPSDPRIWRFCSGRDGYAGEDILEDLLGALSELPQAGIDYGQKLDECREHHSLRTSPDSIRDFQYGYDYLASQGVPVLPPPSSVTRELQREAEYDRQDLQRRLSRIEQRVEKELEVSLVQELGKELITHKHTHTAIAELARAVNKTAQQELSKELEDLQKASNGDQGQIIVLQSRLNRAEQEGARIETLLTGLGAAQDAHKLPGIFSDATSGDPRQMGQALIDTTDLVEKYFKKYQKSTGAAARQWRDMAAQGLSPEDARRFEQIIENEQVINTALSGVSTALKAGKWGAYAYDAYQDYKRLRAEADRMAASGRYTEAQARMLNAFNVMSDLSRRAAGRLPPGISEMSQFYAEALALPGQVDQMMRELVDRHDVMADISGTQAQTEAMRRFGEAHPNASLDRDDYLFRQAGLSAYIHQPGGGQRGIDRPYVLLPRADADPIYIDQRTRDRLMEAAYYFPLANDRRMTDADVEELLRNVGDAGTSLAIDDWRRAAEKRLKDAAYAGQRAELIGPDEISMQTLTAFSSVVWESLPERCQFSRSTEKRLLRAYARQPEAVESWIREHGLALTVAEARRDARQGQ
ncbi:hypothetical protein M911_04975 [Ectothiorhodospira haloalkaliphila]|uniref:Uncharacterized protein n=1 Tax=Ectothiorhodospira haloalkaliphila TaxID=421628 RepID=W8KLI7_9GAMM|nr:MULTISPECIES: hypothetical protein [Ectothiorhodospira]AHK80619.1 hypothetical protein M911_04975 [Ectothiorhodospira haloalkaliphila]MCG5495481.1 hypothetical protein [Ectothiorhodospira variabilis]MCG5498928.1 hypothetical protein [Ectothiorhodospira variabilis]MCG5503910.1 hypothetical protein [Ectothiorhodospira variabilis]MCG5506959.1 hypothetical protein [Ectothiorhodospira variabilis]